MALTQWQTGGRKVVVSHKPEAITISFTEQELVSYDLAGRYLGSYDHGTNIRRGLDNTYQQRWRVVDGRKYHPRQRVLSEQEAEEHVEDMRIRVRDLLKDKAAVDSHPATAAVLERIWEYSFRKLMASAGTFTRLYGHIPILPPDQYRALVVQMTDGCTYNKCTFCTLYRDKIFRVRTLEDFRRHVSEVLEFIGEGLSYRTSLFLGDANAIAVRTARLLELVEILNGFPVLQPLVKKGGMHAFLDIYTGNKKSVDELRLLKEQGLRRVSLGIESGSAALLEFVHKPGSRADVIDVVRNLKAAGLSVVTIFMVGLGGHDFRAQHLSDSVSLAQELSLSRGDIVYLSHFSPGTNAPYLPIASEAGVRAMTADEIDAETRRWKQVLGEVFGGTGVKVAPYSFQRFIY
ncbi:MAG: radical SAM protein [Fidelibacterota bacterium]|nr:MAG: radical SAM protein [Candidatus Neomarinimicrobiota bacterium]